MLQNSFSFVYLPRRRPSLRHSYECLFYVLLRIKYETPKKHFLGRNRVIWAIKCRDRSRGLIGTAWQEYKKTTTKNKKTKGSPDEVTNWVSAPPTPLIRSLPYLVCGVAPWTCFLVLSFGSIAPQISELQGVKNRPFPLTRHIAYTTACCYRTSRDERKG